MNTITSSIDTWKPFLTKEGVEAHARDVYKRYEQTSFYINPAIDNKRLAPFGKLPIEHPEIPDGICSWASGMALLAGRLKEKNNLNHLMVAHTIEAFVASLREKCSQESPFRCAWVLFPAQSWCPLPPNYPMHKVCVGVEISKDGEKKIVKMVILDGLPIGRQGYITPERLQEPIPEDIWEGYGINDKFNAPELICRAFFKGIEGLNITSKVFHCPVIRLTGPRCDIIALKDAQQFLQNNDFFTQIKTQAEVKFPIENATLQKITHLPVEHMKGTQSLEILEKYTAELLSMPLADKTSPASEDPSKDFYLSRKYMVTNLKAERTNEYTTLKMLKYSSWAIEMLEQQPEKARILIDSTLVHRNSSQQP